MSEACVLQDVADYWRKVKSGELPAPSPNDIDIAVWTVEAAIKCIAELESRLAKPVCVQKLTVIECEAASLQSREYCEGWCAGNDWAIHHIRAAGFKCEGDA